jgi:K+/H+ antiporter YhaU regulatory subunit KhtT
LQIRAVLNFNSKLHKDNFIEKTYPSINIIAIKHINDWYINIEPQRTIEANDFISFIGDKKDLKALNKAKS